MLFFKQFGIGLATAILLDATIVRAVFLPATMKLLGDWNWYLPRWLDWLPHVDPQETPEAPEAKRVAVSAEPYSGPDLESMRSEAHAEPAAGVGFEPTIEVNPRCRFSRCVVFGEIAVCWRSAPVCGVSYAASATAHKP